VVNSPRCKRASDLDGTRLLAGREAWTQEAERRTHSNKQRDKLLAIIRRCGFINPFIVRNHSIVSV
jgi:hypothetical protein